MKVITKKDGTTFNAYSMYERSQHHRQIAKTGVNPRTGETDLPASTRSYHLGYANALTVVNKRRQEAWKAKQSIPKKKSPFLASDYNAF